MSSNFYCSSHNRYHLHPRPLIHQARSIDRLYATPHQLVCLGIWFANLIQKVGKRLMLRQIPIATATIYFKRFYLKNSYCETNPYLVLAACVFVAAKVEETPVHIKSVVSESKTVFVEHGIKSFPAEAHKLGEMEFYLLEDLDFHLIIFHPYRSLLAACGREPSDPGKFEKSRIEEDAEIRKTELEAKKKRDEEIRKAGPGGGAGGGVGGGARVTSATGAAAASTADEGLQEGETEEERIIRLMRRGTGEGLMEVEESVLQISMFLLNDTYRTDVHLLYPPHIIALAALYIGFTLSSMTPATRSRSVSSQMQMALGLSATEINAALSLPAPPTASSEFLASFQVSLPILMACVQDIIVLYPIWEKFEPSGAIKGKQPVEDAQAKAKAQAQAKEVKFGPDEAEALVKRMIDERMRDVIAAEDTKEQVIGKKRSR